MRPYVSAGISRTAINVSPESIQHTPLLVPRVMHYHISKIRLSKATWISASVSQQMREKSLMHLSSSPSAASLLRSASPAAMIDTHDSYDFGRSFFDIRVKRAFAMRIIGRCPMERVYHVVHVPFSTLSVVVPLSGERAVPSSPPRADL